ncbi:MAG: N-6 DNA methylase [Ignavibacteriae bacterium]|nr:N-6 DNA methylase [Ignavibacteriota bacterium]
MSEELLQKDLKNNPEKIGKWDFYNIGSTTIKQLKENGIIRNIDYGIEEKKKVDALVVQKKNVIAVVEYKKPTDFNTEEKKQKAIKQELEVAKKLKANILIATDNQESIWINVQNGNSIKGEDGSIIKTVFNPKDEKLPEFIEKIINSINEKNDQIVPPKLVNPTDLAKKIWQIVWSISGATPESCLYSFVELFIFKYLSDLNVLQEPENFDYLLKLYEKKNPEFVISYYARNIRLKIKNDLFPKGNDGTTIINGTVFVNNDDEAIEGRSTAFEKILKEFEKYGKLDNIHPDFKSQLFESFLKESISQKNWGQFFTPLKVVKSIVKMAEDFIKPNLIIGDPASGVGKFLLEAIKPKLNQFYKVEKNKLQNNIEIIGYDIGFDKDEQKTIILAKANMLIYFSELLKNNKGITKQFASLFNKSFELKKNSILGTLAVKEEEKFDLILSNPPYVTSGSSNVKEEIKRKGLSDYYKINAMGLEGLFMEWIIKALKPNGKAFIVVPDGIFNRQNDAKLRKYILDECFIDAIISLPLNTFFTTNKKTFILSITKKIDKKEEQVEPVFTYLVSEIGETRDVYRFDTEQNDLLEAVTLFSFFKGNKSNFEKINTDRRCKIQPIEKFTNEINSSWIIDKWWTEEEKINLGIEEKQDKLDLFDFSVLIQNVSETIRELGEELKEFQQEKKKAINKQKFFLIRELFNIERGKSKYTKKYGNQNRGNFPVYSASNNNPLTFINSFDLSGRYLTWATNGFAGYMKIIDGKFSINGDRGLLKLKQDSVVIDYMKIVLEPKLRELAKGRKGEKGEDEFTKVYPSMIKNIKVALPIDESENIDIERQKDIVEKYNATQEIIKQVKEYRHRIQEISVEIKDNYKFKPYPIEKIFATEKGLSKYTNEYIKKNKGSYPVYSSQTVNEGIIGYINTYDYDTECLTWTTDGIYAGTVFYRNGKFSMTTHCGALLPKNKNTIYLGYLYFYLKSNLKKYALGEHNKRITVNIIKKIIVDIPVKENDEFSIEAQKEITSKFKKIDEIKKIINLELKKIEETKINYE